MTNGAAEDRLSQVIINQMKDGRPESVEQLVALVRERVDSPEERIVKEILQLHGQGKIRFQKPPKPGVRKMSAYIRTEDANWFWATITFSIVTTIIVFTVPEGAYPLVYARYALGTIFVIWMPGYAFVRVLFPHGLSGKFSKTDLDIVERVALSLGISLALVPIVGLLLNYTPWGIRLTPIVLSLLALTIILAMAAIVREWQSKAKLHDQKTG